MASNALQNTSIALLTFEIVGQVRGLELDDSRIITAKGEVKWFFLDFESLGAGTCVFMDFKDGVTTTFGDEFFCNEWAPEVPYTPGIDMVIPVTVTHTY